MDLGPASVSPEPMTAILTAPTRIKLTGLKRPAPVADEENGLSQLEAHSTAHAAAEILPSTAAGDATPGAAHPPKRIRPTREGVRRGKWTTEEQVRPRGPRATRVIWLAQEGWEGKGGGRALAGLG